MSDRERIVAAARKQLGVSYFSMNYSASEGYAGWMGTHYVGKGWGCAQFVAYCLNTVLGTAYVGSCYNYGGDALGQGENQGGGQFRFISAAEAKAGDCVLYGRSGYDGSRYDHYGHIALYVGNGRVIGAMGKGKPWDYDYLNIGIKETPVASQNIGGITRYIRCTRINDSTEGGVFPLQQTVTFKCKTNVRDAPSVTAGKVVSYYPAGESCTIDGVKIAGGICWGHYIGSTSGKDRYVSLTGTIR